MRSSRKLVVLACLYAAQGLPFGFFTQAVPVLMREQGHSLERVGLASLLAWPWALKFAWAPWVDRVGSRARVVVATQCASALVLLALAAWSPARGLAPLLIAVSAVNLFAATQDIATDALAVEALAPGERGAGNAAQVGGYRVGMVLGGGALLVAFDVLGYAGSFAALAAASMLAVAPLVIAGEARLRSPRAALAAREGEATVGARGWLDALRSFYASVERPGALLALLGGYKFGDAFGTGMVKPMLVDLGFDVKAVGVAFGLAGSGAAIAGSLAGGAVVGRLGARPALVALGALQVAPAVAYLGLAVARGRLALATVIAASALEHFVSAMASVALFSVMMGHARPGSAGVDYTVQATAVVALGGAAAALGGAFAHRAGFTAHFALAVVLCAVAPVVAWWSTRAARPAS